MGLEKCTMGVGCMEGGTCYAAAHGEPERCPVLGDEDVVEELVDAVGEALGVETGLCPEHRFKEAMAAARAHLARSASRIPVSLKVPYEIFRSMLHGVALSDHLGDAGEAINDGLLLLGLPPMPTSDDGSMSPQGWLKDAPHLVEAPTMPVPLFSEAFRAALVESSLEVEALRRERCELMAEREAVEPRPSADRTATQEEFHGMAASGGTTLQVELAALQAQLEPLLKLKSAVAQAVYRTEITMGLIKPIVTDTAVLTAWVNDNIE